jgi:hypothetical protein
LEYAQVLPRSMSLVLDCQAPAPCQSARGCEPTHLAFHAVARRRRRWRPCCSRCRCRRRCCSVAPAIAARKLPSGPLSRARWRTARCRVKGPTVSPATKPVALRSLRSPLPLARGPRRRRRPGARRGSLLFPANATHAPWPSTRRLCPLAFYWKFMWCTPEAASSAEGPYLPALRLRPAPASAAAAGLPSYLPARPGHSPGVRPRTPFLQPSPDPKGMAGPRRCHSAHTRARPPSPRHARGAQSRHTAPLTAPRRQAPHGRLPQAAPSPCSSLRNPAVRGGRRAHPVSGGPPHSVAALGVPGLSAPVARGPHSAVHLLGASRAHPGMPRCGRPSTPRPASGAGRPLPSARGLHVGGAARPARAPSHPATR